MKKLGAFFRKEMVLTIALAAALLSLFLTPPGPHILAGIDVNTLLMLFSLMTVVAGLRDMGVFDLLGSVMTRRIHTLRGLAATLTAACFFLSMAATNDVALLTLVPFTLLLMQGASGGSILLTVVLETIAANLGSMVTPIGNPQNLYLYASGRLALADFPGLTWPYALTSLTALMILCRVLIPAEKVAVQSVEGKTLPKGKLTLYLLLTVLALLTIAKVLPAWLLASAVMAGALAMDRRVLRRVDWALLATFVCFFVFVASVKEYTPIKIWLETMMAASPLLVSLACSQVISNVPACLLLSPFTGDAASLMLGVNLGGLGTLVASLASLISFKLYGAAPEADKGRFLIVFTGLNAAFLAMLLMQAWLMGTLF